MVIGCETVSADLAAYPSVHIDNVAAAREATQYLISQGHRRIAFIYGQEESLLTKDREDGYRAAMQEAGLPIESGWVLEGKLTIEGAISATRRLLKHRQRPTAIFCANDEMAMGCMHELRRAGLRIPADMSVVGFDDTRYAEIQSPPLTTVRQPAEEIGERVIHRLLREIEEGKSHGPEAEIVPHRLIIRQSAAPPRNSSPQG
jgi:LacI family repressor for deo operon, udp, cdd, tsx, nupC, and nupG